MKILKKLEANLEEWILGALLIGMSLILFLQIVMRVLGNSLTWAEEVARYFYVWSVFLSLGCTMRGNYILRVDLLLSHLPTVLRRGVETLLDLLNTVLFAFFCYCSIDVIVNIQSSGQTSPALEIPMYLVYAVVPVGFGLAALRSVQNIFARLTGPSRPSAASAAESI